MHDDRTTIHFSWTQLFCAILSAIQKSAQVLELVPILKL